MSALAPITSPSITVIDLTQDEAIPEPTIPALESFTSPLSHVTVIDLTQDEAIPEPATPALEPSVSPLSDVEVMDLTQNEGKRFQKQSQTEVENLFALDCSTSLLKLHPELLLIIMGVCGLSDLKDLLYTCSYLYQLGVGILYKSYPRAAFKICYEYTNSDAAIGALRHIKEAKTDFHLEERVLTWDPLTTDFHNAYLSAISMAAARGKERIVRYLVSECKVQINPIPDDPVYIDWISPLEAAIRGQQVEMVKILVEMGARTSFSGGRSALHVAAAAGSIELFNFFLEAGCEITQKDDNSNTPFTFAIASSNPYAMIWHLENCGLFGDRNDYNRLERESELQRQTQEQLNQALSSSPHLSGSKLRKMCRQALRMKRGYLSEVLAETPNILYLLRAARTRGRSRVTHHIPRSIEALIDELIVGGFSLDIYGLRWKLYGAPFWR
ncbi:ankyrin repeat-containing domain protein [Dactylonectria macrodidyma]|uniref:Ankyrin repeat-containing domain protein n=1 Tax=Dactylonectria macrodidyma TaxID=307937 RepID=A0A9P9ISW4_9HYPO|nr:ankyrin repeat-containing domain protein [Dactylonectria macrodidyma]